MTQPDQSDSRIQLLVGAVFAVILFEGIRLYTAGHPQTRWLFRVGFGSAGLLLLGESLYRTRIHSRKRRTTLFGTAVFSGLGVLGLWSAYSGDEIVSWGSLLIVGIAGTILSVRALYRMRDDYTTHQN